MFALCVQQAGAVEVLPREGDGLAAREGLPQILFEAVADDDHVALAEDGYASVGRQADGIDADNRAVERDVVLGDGVVAQGFGNQAV